MAGISVTAGIEVGTGLPGAPGGADTTGSPSIAAAARAADDMGLESVWISDLILGDGTPALDAPSVLAAAAAATKRLRIA